MEGLEPSLQSATREELLAKIVEQAEEIEQLKAAVLELQRRLGRPKKDSTNSSVPPSQEQKENKKPGEKKKRKRRGFSSWRELNPNPDKVVDAYIDSCPHCEKEVEKAIQGVCDIYERLEIPPVKVITTRINIFGCDCPHCGKGLRADAPEGMEKGSPFGRSIDALVLLLHYTQAVSYKRLKELMSEVFSLEISQGAIRNIINRSKERFEERGKEIMEVVRGSPVVCSDETGTRVEGSKWWEWVFVAEDAVVHVIRDSRGRKVVEEVLEEYEPNVWVSDLYGAQLSHGEKYQVCLAHQIRDLKYAVDCGDRVFAPDMRELLCEAMDAGKHRDTLDNQTLEERRRGFEQRVEELLSREPTDKEGIRLRNRYMKHADGLFVFLADRNVPYTNNVSERSIRMSKMFLKVTNGFRSVWGADMFGAVRSVINTGKIHGLSPYESIVATLEGRSIIPA